MFSFTNLLVLAKCNLVTDLMTLVMSDLTMTRVMRTRTLPSRMAASDDVTILAMLSGKSSREVIMSLKVSVLVNYALSRLCNLHVNMSKSGLTAMVTEFNSGTAAS